MKRDVAAGHAIRVTRRCALARELAARFHGGADAEHAIGHWNAVVRGSAVDVDLPLLDVACARRWHPHRAAVRRGGAGGRATRRSTRKLNERAVRIDGAVVEDRELVLRAGAEHLLQVGKRAFARVRLVAA